MSIGWFKPQRLPEGEMSPDFTLPSTAGDFHLHEELKKGPVLMMFYMGDFGTGCTLALNRLAEVAPQIEALGVRVTAISVNSMTMHQRYLGRMDFPFPLISDVGGEVTKKYGVLIENHILYAGMAGRAVYIMGKDGRVLYSWVPVDDPADSPDFQGLVEAVRSFS